MLFILFTQRHVIYVVKINIPPNHVPAPRPLLFTTLAGLLYLLSVYTRCGVKVCELACLTANAWEMAALYLHGPVLAKISWRWNFSLTVWSSCLSLQTLNDFLDIETTLNLHTRLEGKGTAMNKTLVNVCWVSSFIINLKQDYHGRGACRWHLIQWDSRTLFIVGQALISSQREKWLKCVSLTINAWDLRALFFVLFNLW